MKQKPKNNNFILFGFATLLLFLIIPGQSQAQLSVVPDSHLYQARTNLPAQKMDNTPGGLHLGSIKIHPRVDVNEAYESNIFQEESHKKSAWLTTIGPGVSLLLPLRRHSLQLDYHAEIIEASRFHKQFNTDNHFVNGILNLDFNRLNIQAGDNWESNSTAPVNEQDIRNDYLQNRAFCDIGYRLATRYTVHGFYRNTSRQFDNTRSSSDPTADPEWDNYTENDMGTSLYYRFLPKTSVLFEYGFTHHNQNDRGLTDTNRDYDAQRYWLGLMWEPTAKIKGTIKGGYYQQNFAAGSSSQDWDGFSFEGNLQYAYTSRDSFTLTGFRYPIETSVNESHVPGYAPGLYGTYSVTTGGTLTYNHRFTYKISGIADISYFHDNYSEKGSLSINRDDDRIYSGIGVLYQIRDWVGLKSGYRYEDCDSNAFNESYRNHIFSATLSLTF